MDVNTFSDQFLRLDEWGSALGYALTTGVGDELEEKVAELEARADNLCAIQRVKSQVEATGVFSATFKWVPSDYYERSLGARAQLLGCKEHQLCKAMVMVNTAFQLAKGQTDECDPRNSRYYIVVVQYCAKFNADKLARAVHSLLPEPQRLSKKAAFHFRVADEDVGCALAGFRHNGVSPFGLVDPKKLPLIAAAAVFGDDVRSSGSCPIVWMGGGHPDLKLGCTPTHFIKALRPVVADISDPR